MDGRVHRQPQPLAPIGDGLALAGQAESTAALHGVGVALEGRQGQGLEIIREMTLAPGRHGGPKGLGIALSAVVGEEIPGNGGIGHTQDEMKGAARG